MSKFIVRSGYLWVSLVLVVLLLAGLGLFFREKTTGPSRDRFGAVALRNFRADTREAVAHRSARILKPQR
jgi:hypothetical protein